MERVLTRNIANDPKPINIIAYEANEGYQGLKKSIF